MAIDEQANDPSLEGRFGEIAEEYTQRLERGEGPNIEEYADRHPELAGVIREVFPALEAMRPSASADAEASGLPDAGGGADLLSQHLGDYRIVREIGRGGMGIVYEAEQRSLHRRVALKVLPFAAVLDPKQLQRFKNEAQAAANLHHSNIVPVFALGCERGVYYYAMQFINGHPLSLVIQELERLKGHAHAAQIPGSTSASQVAESLTSGRWTPPTDRDPASSNLDCAIAGSSVATRLAGEITGKDGASPSFFRAAAKLGIQVADAMQYAHDHGIIHRDIKPSNLLVDAEGHVWVADFGLALMQASPNLTLPGDLLGTARYMSPEQALANRVPIDHRTDIYSLGVTLYELLALRPAFDGNDRQELLRQIAFEDPRPLRRVNASMPKELETIVGKCTAKRPDDRYPSAQDLAADLRRFLADQPILAKPPTIRDRVSKWSRRHRAVVMSSCVSLLVAVVGLSASTVLVLHQRNLARQQHDRAEANLRMARGNVDRMLKWMEAQEFSQLPYLARLRQDVLEESLSFHRSLLPEKVHDPDARRDAGEVYLQLGRIKALLGHDAEAAQAYRDGIKMLDDLVRDYPTNSGYGEKLASGCFDMAAAFWEAKRFDDAEEPVRRAVGLFQKLSGDCPAVPYYPEQQRRSLDLLGLVLRDRGRLDDAQATLQRAVMLGTALVKRSPNEPQQRVELARTYRNLADVQLKLGHSEDAGGAVRLAINMQADLAAAYPHDAAYADEMSRTQRWWDQVMGLAAANPVSQARPVTSLPAAAEVSGSRVHQSPELAAQVWDSLGNALRRLGKSEDATEAYRQAVAAQEKLVASHPSTVDYRKRLFDTHTQQGKAMLGAWRLDESEEAFQQALETASGLVVAEPANPEYTKLARESLSHLQMVRTRLPVGDIVGPAKQSPEGVELAVERARRLDPAVLPNDPMPMLIYADYLILGDDAQRAVPFIRQAIDVGGKSTCFCKSLGVALLRTGQPDEARAEFAKALETTLGQKQTDMKDADLDQWTAAYFLDRVTREQFTGRWSGRAICVGSVGPLPWFYVGLRMEIEGKPHEARAAYTKAVEQGRAPNAHVTANWAAYRLKRLGPDPSLTKAPLAPGH